MAGRCIRRLDKANTSIKEFVCDSEEDIKNLPTMTTAGKEDFYGYERAPMGSTCIVGNEGGDVLIYMLFSFGWKQI
jgi:hypothetical protein